MKTRSFVSLLAVVGLSAACSSAPLSPSPPAPDLGGKPSGSAATQQGPATPADADAFIADVNDGLRDVYVKQSRADWINQTYITDDTDALSADAAEATMEYTTRKIKESVRFRTVTGLSPDTARQLELLRRGTVLPSPDDAKKRKELAELGVAMQSTYGKGKYCSDKLAHFKKQDKDKKQDKPDNCLTLGDLSKILEDKKATYDELLEAWKGWRTISVPMRKQYERFVELGNEGAREIGYKDLSGLWKDRYDMPPEAFEADVERLWQQVKPLYDELHCYARSRMRKKWGADKIGPKAAIPAHLFGNMWSQTWGGIYDVLEPYPGQTSLDVTAGIKKKKLDEKGMIKLGESFFVSLGMPNLPPTFWDRSLIAKPRDREVVCHASAWDLTYNNDVRIKMCTELNEEDLITIHHELGHDYYFTAYHTMPVLYQDGANDGFHEGIGDTLALSVTPEYLVKIGLLDKAPANDKAELNVLMRRALDKVAFLPFGLLIDKWRWDVFSGKITPAQYNKAWWDLVMKYQGIAPPIPRSESDFDPGAKYHVPANVPYLRYFLADIYQFQFHRALCKAAGYKGPLHKCSIYGSKEAGQKLEAMLAMGASKPWPEAMRAISGETQADASAIIEYFAPLMEWLKEQNKGEQCGW
ncbi:MAG TPA: M2 family metallopeptidase [Polyangiaceae bacterium]|jgi:peptidyl-dipeptidase A|nr:M2 family metallopeptidase [Polyangiaceae bacterium]